MHTDGRRDGGLAGHGDHRSSSSRPLGWRRSDAAHDPRRGARGVLACPCSQAAPRPRRAADSPLRVDSRPPITPTGRAGARRRGRCIINQTCRDDERVTPRLLAMTGSRPQHHRRVRDVLQFAGCRQPIGAGGWPSVAPYSPFVRREHRQAGACNRATLVPSAGDRPRRLPSARYSLTTPPHRREHSPDRIPRQ